MIDQSRRVLLTRLLGAAALLAAGTADSSEDRAQLIVAFAHALLNGLHAPELAPFLNEWPTVLRRRRVAPSSVPALRWLPEIQAATPEFSTRLVSALVAAGPILAWRRTYTAAEAGATFLDNYGWTEFIGLTGPVSGEHLACGVLLLGPQVAYPRHRHEAEEIYVPLAGTAAWQSGDGPWLERPPGSVIHHLRHEPHAMRTGASAILALYLWRSSNLAQKSHLDPELGPA